MLRLCQWGESARIATSQFASLPDQLELKVSLFCRIECVARARFHRLDSLLIHISAEATVLGTTTAYRFTFAPGMDPDCTIGSLLATHQ